MKLKISTLFLLCLTIILGHAQTRQNEIVNEAISLYGFGRIDEAFKTLRSEERR